MVKCFIKGCVNRSEKRKISFFRIPGGKNLTGVNRILIPSRQAEWLKRINRTDITENKLKYSRICGAHFISGRPSKNAEINSPDWAPSLKLGADYVNKQKENPVIIRPVPSSSPQELESLQPTEQNLMQYSGALEKFRELAPKLCAAQNSDDDSKPTENSLPEGDQELDSQEIITSDANPPKRARTEYTAQGHHASSSRSSSEEANDSTETSNDPDSQFTANIKIEYDDGSYDNPGGDGSSKDIIPSALCEVVINTAKDSEKRPLVADEESPKSNSMFGTLIPANPVLLASPNSNLVTVPQTQLIPVTGLTTLALSSDPTEESGRQTVVTPSTSNCSSEHPLETFFRSMARTVLTFPAHMIAEARMKVCNVVSEMEIRSLKEGFSNK